MKGHHSNENSNISCESFEGYEDEVELLKAIAEWWNEQELKYEMPTIFHIEITYDEDGCKGDVYYDWLTPKAKQELVDLLKEQRPLKIEKNGLSNN
jgi:hypothetical protein